jgi:transcription termination/antitermination protein NusG
MSDEQEKHEGEDAATAVADEPAGDAAVVDSVSIVEPDASAAEPAAALAETGAAAAAEVAASKKHWYVVKVQSGREESIKNAILRKVKIDGLEEYVGRILIPSEKVTELRGGKRVVKKRKKFPGYLMCEVEYNDKILYLFRETSGVGDFVGGSLHKPPTPMGEREVERMLLDEEEVTPKKGGHEEEPTKKKFIIPYGVGDRVKVRDGTFKDMDGEVKEITDPHDSKENPKVKVVLSIWGRPVDVEVEYWQVDPV